MKFSFLFCILFAVFFTSTFSTVLYERQGTGTQNVTVTLQSSDAQNYASVYPYGYSSTVVRRWDWENNASCETTGGATSDIPQNFFTSHLQITDWGFNIPPFSNILLIQLNYTRTSNTDNVYDNTVGLVKNGYAQTPNITTQVVPAMWPLSSTGGAKWINYPKAAYSPIWGVTWTPEEINSPNFGISIQATKITGPGIYTAHLSVSCVEVSIVYEPIFCPNNCSYPNGSCNEDGTCTCTSNYEGGDCGIEIPSTTGEVTTAELTSGDLTSAEMTTGEVTTYSMTSAEVTTGSQNEMSSSTYIYPGNNIGKTVIVVISVTAVVVVGIIGLIAVVKRKRRSNIKRFVILEKQFGSHEAHELEEN